MVLLGKQVGVQYDDVCARYMLRFIHLQALPSIYLPHFNVLY